VRNYFRAAQAGVVARHAKVRQNGVDPVSLCFCVSAACHHGVRPRRATRRFSEFVALDQHIRASCKAATVLPALPSRFAAVFTRPSKRMRARQQQLHDYIVALVKRTYGGRLHHVVCYVDTDFVRVPWQLRRWTALWRARCGGSWTSSETSTWTS
jgi:hypothetical protein